ncbi:MAG: hypothetical protein CMD81_08545 [Gammaproteobacteria bacterium]|nr:hypothetical protein [Gammaproteobacteria bacterium]MBK83867.1 hypothetical protein [Gammaproteobacteria bacterium]HBF09026.1 hypothetical protein [Gammaproteobacteria bacterium]|tara:strand:- start:339 stop:3719 length:3381 start_codon:yes stop_codon:yes gene_type:complete
MVKQYMIRLLAQSGLMKRIDKVLLGWVGLAVAALGTYFIFQFANQQVFSNFKKNAQNNISSILLQRESEVSLKDLESKIINELHLLDIKVLPLEFEEGSSNLSSHFIPSPQPDSSVHYYWGNTQTFITFRTHDKSYLFSLQPDSSWERYVELPTSVQLFLIFLSSVMCLPFALYLLRHQYSERSDGERCLNETDQLQVDAAGLQQYLALAAGMKQKNTEFEHFSERVDFALASLRIGIWEYDLQSGQLIWSDEMFSIFKLEKEKFNGAYEDFSNLIVPEDAQIVSEKFFAAIEHKIDFRLHFRIFHPNGDIRTLEATGLPKIGKNGEVVRVVGTNRDVTVVEENALKVEKLSRVASQTQNLLVLTDCDGMIDWVNDAFCDVTGYLFDAVIGRDLLNMNLVRNNEARPQAILRKVISNESAYSSIWKIKKKDGQTGYYDVRCTPMFDKAYRLQGMVVACVDVTESRKTHRLLARKQAMLEEMSYQGRMGAWEINVLSGDVEVSNMFRDIFEIYDDNFDLSGFMDLYNNESKDILRQAISDCIDHDKQFRVEVKAITTSGREVWVAITGIAEYEVMDGQNICARIFGSIQDVSAQQDVKNALMDAKEAAENAAQIKTQFLANMSHEIRTPMNGIIGMLELMLQENLSGKLQQFSSLALTSAKGLLTIINDILDFSKIESGKMELEQIDFNLPELLQSSIESLSFMAEKKGLKCSTDFSELKWNDFKGDPTRIRQMVINLFGNAIKFTSTGEVGVRARQVEGEHVQIIIFDTGIGIPEDRVDQLFSAFTQVDASTTRHFGGSGLGLAITRNLTELMNGHIHVNSKYGHGSEFIITLPLAAGKVTKVSTVQKVEKQASASCQSTSEPATESTELQPLKGLRVLLVDDNLVNQVVGKGVLNKLQCNIAVANDGQECLELLKADEFDVVLMDCQMPVMDGFTATEAIRNGEAGEKYRGIPIIALTANAMDGDRQRCLDSGMSDYLMKPLNFDLLKERLHHWCCPSNINNVCVWQPAQALELIGDKQSLTSRMAAYLDELDQDLKHFKSSQLENSAQIVSLDIVERARGIKLGAEELVVDRFAMLATHLETAAVEMNYDDLRQLIERLQLDTEQLSEEFRAWRGGYFPLSTSG